MLHLENKNLNLNGSSVVDDMYIASMNANYTEPNFVYNINITNIGFYIEHKQEVDSDINSFITTALETASAIALAQSEEVTSSNAEIEIKEEM